MKLAMAIYGALAIVGMVVLIVAAIRCGEDDRCDFLIFGEFRCDRERGHGDGIHTCGFDR